MQTRPMRRKAGVRLFDHLTAEPIRRDKAINLLIYRNMYGMQWYTFKQGSIDFMTEIPALQALHHVQLAMPIGQEDAARAFYQGMLGLDEVAKPPILAARGGVWFQRGAVRVHLGVEVDFHPAKKAHPAFLVTGVTELLTHLEAAGVRVLRDNNLPGFIRGYIEDPFGNRIELLEPET